MNVKTVSSLKSSECNEKVGFITITEGEAVLFSDGVKILKEGAYVSPEVEPVSLVVLEGEKMGCKYELKDGAWELASVPTSEPVKPLVAAPRPLPIS